MRLPTRGRPGHASVRPDVAPGGSAAIPQTERKEVAARITASRRLAQPIMLAKTVNAVSRRVRCDTTRRGVYAPRQAQSDRPLSHDSVLASVQIAQSVVTVRTEGAGKCL